MEVVDYTELVKSKRKEWFKQPYDLIYDNFLKLELDKQTHEYFVNNASDILEKLRNYSWKEFYPLEKEFTSLMLRQLINEEQVKHFEPIQAITWFIEKFPEHIYSLTLSNTQSRRSRAGKEFEAIIELILIGAGVPLDSQGNIGKTIFVNKGIGKMVDFVSPSAIEFFLNKRNTVLISAKTTLRERWQEVPEEMGRTGAKEMFLATLDTNISNEVLNTLYEANIQVTTTKQIKDTYYKGNNRVLTFEQLIQICLNNAKLWDGFEYTEQDRIQMTQNINKQMQKHSDKQFIQDYYQKQLIKLSATQEENK